MQRKFIRDKWGIDEWTHQLAYTSAVDANGVQIELRLGGIGSSGIEDLFYSTVLDPGSMNESWDVSGHTAIKEAMRKGLWYSEWAGRLAKILHGSDITFNICKAFDSGTLNPLIQDQVTERDLYKPMVRIVGMGSAHEEGGFESGPIIIPLWVSSFGVLAATSYTSQRISWEPSVKGTSRVIRLEDLFALIRNTDWVQAIKEVI